MSLIEERIKKLVAIARRDAERYDAMLSELAQTDGDSCERILAELLCGHMLAVRSAIHTFSRSTDVLLQALPAMKREYTHQKFEDLVRILMMIRPDTGGKPN